HLPTAASPLTRILTVGRHNEDEHQETQKRGRHQRIRLFQHVPSETIDVALVSLGPQAAGKGKERGARLCTKNTSRALIRAPLQLRTSSCRGGLRPPRIFCAKPGGAHLNSRIREFRCAPLVQKTSFSANWSCREVPFV